MRASLIRRLDLGGLILAVATALATVAWGFPLFWAAATTLAPDSAAAPLDGLMRYVSVLLGTKIGLWYLNSLVTSSGVTIVVLLVSASCGYALSQLDFTGRKLLWWVVLLTFMIPIQVLIVNHFMLMNAWKLINTWLGVILPQLVAPVAVIVYKRFFDSIPPAFREAAQIDGANHWQLLFRIYLPMNWSITAALAIIVFIGAWNAFLWPFLAVTREEMMNITVGVTQVREMLGVGELAGALLAGLPVIIVYLLFQRRVTQAIVFSSGVKG